MSGPNKERTRLMMGRQKLTVEWPKLVNSPVEVGTLARYLQGFSTIPGVIWCSSIGCLEDHPRKDVSG